METIDGVPVTDEMIQEWADEAERGYDVDVLKKRGRRPIGDGAARVVPVRMDDSLVAAVDQRLRDHSLSSTSLRRVKVHNSALKHGISAADALYAANHRIYESWPDDDVPAKQFVMGFDSQGRLLELVILTFDSGHQLLIHAMKARRHLLDLID